MTGAGVRMSDRDGYGCLGSIISLLLLAILWPYIIAAIGIYIAFLVLVEILAWIASNWIVLSAWLMFFLGLYLVAKYKLPSRAFARIAFKREKASFNTINWPAAPQSAPEDLTRAPSIFTPTTNLYCYWCTKKLGLQSWERSGKHYCQSCYEAICKKKLDIE